MKVSQFSELTVKALIYLGLKKQSATVSEIAFAYNASVPHLKKVMNKLVKAGYLISKRGKSGGYCLTRPLNAINLGEIFRLTTNDMLFIECANDQNNRCVISKDCKFRHVIWDANSSFYGELDGYSMFDLIKGRQSELSNLLHLIND